MFFSPFRIAITSLGVERANLSAFRTFVRFVLVWICRFPLTLGVWEGLRFVFVALPGLFSYLFFNANNVDPEQTPHSVASDQGLLCLSMSLLMDIRHKWVNTCSNTKLFDSTAHFLMFERICMTICWCVLKCRMNGEQRELICMTICWCVLKCRVNGEQWEPIFMIICWCVLKCRMNGEQWEPICMTICWYVLKCRMNGEQWEPICMTICWCV